MTNFDFLLSEPQFAPFANEAIVAEKIFSIDYSACVVNCGFRKPWEDGIA